MDKFNEYVIQVPIPKRPRYSVAVLLSQGQTDQKEPAPEGLPIGLLDAALLDRATSDPEAGRWTFVKSEASPASLA